MARKVFSFTPGKERLEGYEVGPVQLPEDTHCENCRDMYPARDIIEGWCFLCSVKDDARMYRRFKARGW